MTDFTRWVIFIFMHKKTRLKLKLEPHEKPVVKPGDHIKAGDVLAESAGEATVEINLAKLLQVAGKDLPKFLTKELPVEVMSGEIIALKKSLLAQKRVKSPKSGMLDYLDAEKGTLQIKPRDAEANKARAWFDGIIKEVSSHEVVCEVSGLVVNGKAGAGGTVSGKLFSIKGEVKLFSLPTDIEDKIIILKSAGSDVVAKADALGAVAVIAETLEEPPFKLPHLIVSDIKDIMVHENKHAILHAEEKQLLIIEGESKEHKSNKNKD